MYRLIEEVKYVKGRSGLTRPPTRQVRPRRDLGIPQVEPAKRYEDGLSLRERAVSAARQKIHNGDHF